MTMKEMEQESGMTRANIRYYEAEGLLSPARGANRYRDYSQEDLEVLKKIKLLRSLQLSLEEIRALQAGRQELSEVLDRQIGRLQEEKTQIERSQELCRVMRDDGVRYQTLDAQHYLGILEQGGGPASPGEDALPEVRAPWRRYFARGMDLLVYSVLWNVFLALALGVNISMRSEGGRIVDSLAEIGLMLLAEPVLLALLGTTPGKWILGLRVTDNEGRHLTLEEAWARTWRVFLHGMGLGIPLWRLFRMWRSYRTCADGETLEWEYHSAVIQKDESGWRAAGYVGAAVLLGVVFVLAFRISALPKNRGEITVAEFCENYNRFSKYYNYDDGAYLNREGKWIQEESLGNGYTIVIGGHERPVYQFAEEDGKLTGVHFKLEIQGDGQWISGYQNEMILSMLAFAGAQKENGIFFREMEEAVRAVQEAGFESFELSVCGVRVVCESAYSGYTAVPGMGMLVQDGEEGRYALSFSMVKLGE